MEVEKKEVEKARARARVVVITVAVLATELVAGLVMELKEAVEVTVKESILIFLTKKQMTLVPL